MYRIDILKKDDLIDSNVYEDNDLVEMYQENINEPRLEGNIYLGRVKNILNGMQAAFINIGEKKPALIHLADLIPKISEKTGNTNIDISKYNINDFIKKGDMIIVQVKKDYSAEKGPRVTTDIKLVGNYIILLPYSHFITISQKISENKKKSIIQNVQSFIPKDMGAIIRTSAENANDEKIKKDIENLLSKVKSIQKEVDENNGKPIKLVDDMGIVGKLINDLKPFGLEININDNEIYNQIKKSHPDLKIEIKEIAPIKKLDRKVELKKRRIYYN